MFRLLTAPRARRIGLLLSALVWGQFGGPQGLPAHEPPTEVEAANQTAWLVAERQYLEPSEVVTALERGGDPDGFEWTPLLEKPIMRAIALMNKYSGGDRRGSIALQSLQILLAAGADANGGIDPETGARASSPLHAVVRYGNDRHVIETTLLLLENGADPNIKDSAGLAPVYWAAMYSEDYPEWQAVLNALLMHGANPDDAWPPSIFGVSSIADEHSSGRLAEQYGDAAASLLLTFATDPPFESAHVRKLKLEHADMLRLLRTMIATQQQILRHLRIESATANSN